MVTELLKDEEFSKVQSELSENPKKGDVIPKSGGARKIRVAARHKGKRGGLRVIYYFHDKYDRIWFLFLYEKSHKTDITDSELKIIRQVVTTIKDIKK